jgi:hypothetical protein
MFLVKSVFFRCFRKFLVTTPPAEIAEEYIDKLLSLQIFFISTAKLFFFLIFSASVLMRVWVKGTAIAITSAVLLSLSMAMMIIIITIIKNRSLFSCFSVVVVLGFLKHFKAVCICIHHALE